MVPCKVEAITLEVTLKARLKYARNADLKIKCFIRATPNMILAIMTKKVHFCFIRPEDSPPNNAYVWPTSLPCSALSQLISTQHYLDHRDWHFCSWCSQSNTYVLFCLLLDDFCLPDQICFIFWHHFVSSARLWQVSCCLKVFLFAHNGL